MKKKIKTITAVLLAVLMCLSAFAGCAEKTESTSGESAEPDAESAAPADSAEPEESTAAESAAEKVLLAVSFGTSYNDSRDVTIGAVETALQTAYPEYEVRRAFTSQIIIDILAERDGLEIDNVTEAMDRLIADGVKEVVVQPTHVMKGFEYDDVIAEIMPYASQFESFKVGAPLLTSDADYDGVVSVITTETAEYAVDGTAIVFMGHGTEHESNATYARLQKRLVSVGYDNYFIGTVEAEPSLEDMLECVAESGAGKVVLLPLMVVAGDHANNDMAGDEEDSWKTAFEAAGYEVECVLQGLGQYAGIQEMYVEHAGDAISPAEKVLLAVSFGTSYNDSREVTIGGIESALQAAYPEYEVRRAFTSQIIIDVLSERDGIEIDNVTEAMDRLIADGVKELVVQPTHVMKGFEYDDVIAEIMPYASQFESFKLGAPLLTSDADYEAVVSIITEETSEYAVDGTAIVFMGHGTEHESNATYATLQQFISDAGYNNYFIGTVEAEPSLEDMLECVAESGASKVVLLPLMVVAGDHANNDMAGDEEDSWKSAFEAAGYEVECVLQGLGQYAGIQEIYVEHTAEALAG